MANVHCRRHGNIPQRHTAPSLKVAKCGTQQAQETPSPETGPGLESTAEEATPPAQHCHSAGFCEKENRQRRKRHADKNIKALLKRLRVHSEARRILGDSCIAVVSLERLDFQSVFLSCLQPVVCLMRLPRHTQNRLCDDSSLDGPQKNCLNESEAETFEMREASSWSKQDELCDPSQTETTSWTEPYCPDSSPCGEPEQDSGFDCESNPDQPYILCDSESEDGKTESDTFYLDPDAEQTLLIELHPEAEADQGRCLLLEGESDINHEADVVQMDVGEDQKPDLCCLSGLADSAVHEAIDEAGPEEKESEDFCAVCLNGGDLLCCDCCPKVYHLSCHIPPLVDLPLGDWMCTLCRTDQQPLEAYECENMHSGVGVKAPYTLSNQDQRRCERLTLLLYCHRLSAPFHEPVSRLAQNYYQIIRRPIDLSVIRKKLDKRNTLHYFTAEQFVDDVLLMFKNCATFNYPDSEVAQAGRNLEVFFLNKLKEIFPDHTFPSASQDRTDRARLRWLSRKRKDNCRKKKLMFPGKKYYL